MVVLRLVSELNKPDVTIKELERLISQDASLTYKILRYINSAAIGIPQEATSIRKPVIFMGIDRIRAWTNLLALRCIRPTNTKSGMPPNLNSSRQLNSPSSTWRPAPRPSLNNRPCTRPTAQAEAQPLCSNRLPMRSTLADQPGSSQVVEVASVIKAGPSIDWASANCSLAKLGTASDTP